jgi:hypothetical protein
VGELVTEHRLDRGIVEIVQHALRDRDRVRPLASRAARGCLGGVIPHNFTCGACSSCVRVSPRSKNTCGVNPNAVANSAAGNCWMPVLYCGTELLKKRRAKTVEI